jgi:hypothetical protein
MATAIPMTDLRSTSTLRNPVADPPRDQKLAKDGLFGLGRPDVTLFGADAQHGPLPAILSDSVG